ncbi:MAG: hypothetical protein MK205_03665, partial [Candidatus Poseidoniia archaeon]|nr:hypothetical protein [Candidatus Poseidoniia archaeon]
GKISCTLGLVRSTNKNSKRGTPSALRNIARKTPDIAPQANANLRASHGSLSYCSVFLIDLRYIYAGMKAISYSPINAVISLIIIIKIIRINKRTHCLIDSSQPAARIVLPL